MAFHFADRAKMFTLKSYLMGLKAFFYGVKTTMCSQVASALHMQETV